ncbi:MAG: hypothetical protein GF381_03020, partial [Candidatus Pacebacteria bacterium]|nr:hypothetical protein [Candidatus Paceibacterota bacterium]
MFFKNQLLRTGWIVLTAVGLLSLFASPSKAQLNSDNFETTLTSTYTVSVSGQTHVEHLFKIKNLSPTTYVNKYGLQIGSNRIQNIQVTHQGQQLEPQIVQDETQTSIGLTFEEKVVGKNKLNQFSISYQNPDLASVKGRVLEINIPAMANPDYYDQHQAILITPSQFGRPSRITPADHQFEQVDQNLKLRYSQLNGRGISAIYGDEQIYELAIKYHLQNPNNQP